MLISAGQVLAIIAAFLCYLALRDIRRGQTLSRARRTQLFVAAIFFVIAVVLQMKIF